MEHSSQPVERVRIVVSGHVVRSYFFFYFFQFCCYCHDRKRFLFRKPDEGRMSVVEGVVHPRRFQCSIGEITFVRFEQFHDVGQKRKCCCRIIEKRLDENGNIWQMRFVPIENGNAVSHESCGNVILQEFGPVVCRSQELINC